MTGQSPLLRLAARDRVVTILALLAVIGLAWAWLLMHGSDGGMPMEAPPPASAAYFLAAFTMWSLMMVAMMLPSAAPMILLYGRMAERSARGGLLIAMFAAAYLAVWTFFSAAAAAAQAFLVAAGHVSAAGLALGETKLAGALLVAAGLYQLTPLKRACLESCRSPLAFIMRLSRPGALGALRLGLAHGAYCLGCCWALMLLLFVGGVMNLAWIGLLAALVAAEKLAPAWLPTTGFLAAALCGAGAWLLLA